jgi:hypothetical protein
MTVFVHDASILLDLIPSDLLNLFTAIPAAMVTTDFVVAEITAAADASQLAAATESGAFRVLASSVKEMESIAAMPAIAPRSLDGLRGGVRMSCRLCASRGRPLPFRASSPSRAIVGRSGSAGDKKVSVTGSV